MACSVLPNSIRDTHNASAVDNLPGFPHDIGLAARTIGKVRGMRLVFVDTSLNDSLASAANYIKKIGWKQNQPCFYPVKLTKDIKKKYINSSARNISYRFKISSWKKRGIVKLDGSNFESNLKAALIQPDGKPNTPAFLVFDNYEKILKWNRSLRFGISICTLANMIKI